MGALGAHARREEAPPVRDPSVRAPRLLRRGLQVDLHVAGGRIAHVRAPRTGTTMAAVLKGRFALDSPPTPHRLKTRLSARGELSPRPGTGSCAGRRAPGLPSSTATGPDEPGFSCPRPLLQRGELPFQKLARLKGTNNWTTAPGFATRPRDGSHECLRSGAATNPIADIVNAEVILVTGPTPPDLRLRGPRQARRRAGRSSYSRTRGLWPDPARPIGCARRRVRIACSTAHARHPARGLEKPGVHRGPQPEVSRPCATPWRRTRRACAGTDASPRRHG